MVSSLQVEGHINFNIGDLLQIKLFNREKNNAAEMLAFNEISDKLETVLKRLEAVEGYGRLIAKCCKKVARIFTKHLSLFATELERRAPRNTVGSRRACPRTGRSCTASPTTSTWTTSPPPSPPPR